ncbi:hypothetical protein THRCLA_02350 [Thraustotheca clavata]|uniref:Secreted protein n=1 Tax=Thraustotheca clavata TaxID=74557 RepID=A0A1W0A5H1_9STRA|nr:hypothetical protein THRCLA_02350 [Thraustotheca clavata]
MTIAKSLVADRCILLVLSSSLLTCTDKSDVSHENEYPSSCDFLNLVASRGCSAGVAASKSTDDEDWDVLPFKNFLGIQGWMKTPSILKKYKVPHVVLTTMPSVLEHMKDTANYELCRIHELPERVRASAKEPSRNITIVHLSVEEYSEELDACLMALLEEQHESFFGVVKETDLVLPSESRFQSRTLFPLPKQSWAKQNDQYTEANIENHRAMVYAFYAPQQVRPDALTAFDTKEMLEHGGYGIIHASTILKEILFRLGYTPKYGA